MGGQDVSRQSTEDFQGSENIAHDTTMTDLSNPQNAHHREGALYVNYGLQVTMVCQCRFISHNTCPALVGDVDGGGGC